MSNKPLSGLVFLLTMAGFGPFMPQEVAAQPRERPAEADLPPIVAPLIAADGSDAGRVTLRRGPLGLLFVIEGENWPEGWHGAHLHGAGSCELPAFESAAGHVNHPLQPRPHGLLNWDGGPDHGDLQNVYAHSDGIARAEIYLSGAGLGPEVGDMADADGLALVIHANPDDHESQPIGGAGERIACAVLASGG